MDRKVNYQKELDKTIDKITREGVIPTLFLHSCCAPCSSYVLKYLSDYFKITIFYYNPNISPEDEYRERVREQIRLINEMPVKNKVEFMEGRYEPEVFYEMAKGMEDIPEGGERCFKCYELRLREAAVIAKDRGFDYFTTTLSISPLKNAAKLNEIGLKLEEEYNIKYLLSDFKKKEGYKQSVELSKEYNLYRQNYCGCAFSKRKALLREETVNNSKNKLG
ncbi:MAG: epoxyqueuosine reductase QueH [Lachnospiraceae bacterium]|nr:epoxyqueuosine reductase QueH [Lachnospiraceae bacterium]